MKHAPVLTHDMNEKKEFIIAQLKDRNLIAVAASCGLHVNTLYNMVNQRREPTIETLSTLYLYLTGNEFVAPQQVGGDKS